jgi:quercetin dioxygenase-like cupin family protein
MTHPPAAAPPAAEEFANPVTRQRIRIRRAPGASAVGVLEMESSWPVGGAEPPEHLHPRQEERFTVLWGTLRVRLGGETRDFGPGQQFCVPAGTPHAMWNAGDTETRVLWRVAPALRTERLMRTLFALAAQGKTDGRGVPRPLQAAVTLARYREELRLTIPGPAQALLYGVLAPIGRLLGVRADPVERAPVD